MASACSIRVRGVVQGVGFRPFVYRLARANTLGGWVLNGKEGVEIYLEGAEQGLQAFVREMELQPPPAASIAEMEVKPVTPLGVAGFTIRESQHGEQPTARISSDLPVCEDCLEELFDPDNPRYGYPYINCTNCGPRYTVVLGLPYDRSDTTMKDWPLDEYCAEEYVNPGNRRFHAQPDGRKRRIRLRSVQRPLFSMAELPGPCAVRVDGSRGRRSCDRPGRVGDVRDVPDDAVSPSGCCAEGRHPADPR